MLGIKFSKKKNMVKPEKFGNLHLVYHFTIPLRCSNANTGEYPAKLIGFVDLI